MNRITLFSVPHSGTHFMMGLFDTLDIKRDWSVLPDRAHIIQRSSVNAYYWQLHSSENPVDTLRDKNATIYENALQERRKMIVTVRDPYLGALHFISKSERHTLDSMSRQWDMLLDTIKDRDYFTFDIGCRESDRVAHLRDALKFLDVYETEEAINYIQSWKPLNQSNNEFKEDYLATGKLPDAGYDSCKPPNKMSWDVLDEAVEWYKSLPTNDY